MARLSGAGRTRIFSLKAVLWVAGLALALCAGRVLPFANVLDRYGFSQAVYDRNAELLRLTTAPDQQFRLKRELWELSPELVHATLLKEDEFFYYHPGVQPLALARAFWTTFVAGGRRLGGSTITMQLARLHYGLETRGPLGKLTQIAAALWLEYTHSKDEILTAYFNL
ncbi:MAG TPA: transglycosylase domain-containing protein, partial [Bdellovibrionales bacterium]|nr:transglycosylase domain-containing protein [Bdellovibrionales bacterium]